MKILIVNGSPKGKYSVTLQTSLYLEILHPEHEFEIINAAQSVKSLERDFSDAAEKLREADLTVFSYPVYTFLVPSQLHRFVELIKENGVDLKGKYVTQISTSKHFYDVTAHRFIEDNVNDLGMKYIKGLSADMDDLTTEKGRKEAEEFFDYVMMEMENSLTDSRPMAYAAPKHVKVSAPQAWTGERRKTVALVCDLDRNDEQLASMINAFESMSPFSVRKVNIREFPFAGGCISCFNCASTGKCIHKDGFSDMLRNEIQTSDAIVIAFSIKDHSMGQRFKMYDDRQFCNGHRTVTMGMPFGYIISGNLSEEENLRTVIEARAQVGGNWLAGTATDEYDPDGELRDLMTKLSFALEKGYVPPANFYGVGGMKIFRDLIWLMQGIMKEDHRFYKKHGQYDFPQKSFGRMLAMYGAGALMGNEKLKKKMGNKLNEGMIMPYAKVLDEASKRMKG